MKAIVNPDTYGIDLIVDNTFYCEVEVKHNWKGKDFPFSTLQLSDRKRKFAILDNNNEPVIFFHKSSCKLLQLLSTIVKYL